MSDSECIAFVRSPHSQVMLADCHTFITIAYSIAYRHWILRYQFLSIWRCRVPEAGAWLVYTTCRNWPLYRLIHERHKSRCYSKIVLGFLDCRGGCPDSLKLCSTPVDLLGKVGLSDMAYKATSDVAPSRNYFQI